MMIGALGQPALLSPGLQRHRLRPKVPGCLLAAPGRQHSAIHLAAAAAGAGAGHGASPEGPAGGVQHPALGSLGASPLGGESFGFIDARPSGQPASGRAGPSSSLPGVAGGILGGWQPTQQAGSSRGPGTASSSSSNSSSSSTSRSAFTSSTTTATTTTTTASGDGDASASPSDPTAAAAAAQKSTPAPAPSSSGAGNGSAADTDPPGPPKPSPEETVAAALARAQDAIARVETSLETIEDLPGARPPSQWAQVLSLVRTAVAVCALSAALVASQAFGLGVQLVSAVAVSVAVAAWGYTRRSLDASGAVAALLVGTGTIGCSLRFGATLLAFFFSSSKLTGFKDELKEGLDDAHKSNGQRDWRQVLCNGAVPTLLAVAYGVLVGCVDVPFGPSPAMEPWRAQAATLLGGAFLGYYACCCGDTWASELGPLSSDTPRLVTTLRPVRRGTNGGVTLLGLSASILGGVFVGAVFYAAALVSPTLWVLEGAQQAAVGQWRLVPLGLMAGLLGSVLDSVLGATVQYTGYNRLTGRVTSTPGPDVTHISGVRVLDNNAVNLVSASVTSALTGLAALKMFGF